MITLFLLHKELYQQNQVECTYQFQFDQIHHIIILIL